MHITISPEQVALLRALVDPISAAHFDDACEPPGFEIILSFAGPYGSFVEGRCGGRVIDLGELEVRPPQMAWAPTGSADSSRVQEQP